MAPFGRLSMKKIGRERKRRTDRRVEAGEANEEVLLRAYIYTTVYL
jgi:hypothetical protein